MTHRINFRSEFALTLNLLTQSGDQIENFPLDWEARFHTDGIGYCFKASCKAGVMRNCRMVDGAVVVIFDKHHLSPGLLRVEFRANIPDKLYPDGLRRMIEKRALDIRLVAGSSTVIPDVIIADLPLPVTLEELEDIPPQQAPDPDDNPGHGEACSCPEFEPFTETDIKEIIDEVCEEDLQ